MTRPFTQDAFNKLCYLPYNTILTSFLAHGADWKGMRGEQAAEAVHRAAKMRSHPELNVNEWGGFSMWVASTECSFINQLEEGVADGLVIPAAMIAAFEPIAWYICKLKVQAFASWPVPPVRPHWLEYPIAIGIVVA